MELTERAKAIAADLPVIDVAEVEEPREDPAAAAPTTAVAVRESGDHDIDLIPRSDELTVLAQLAVTFAQAGLVPAPLRQKPADVLLVLMTGRGLGIDPLVALRECHPIEGKVTVSPKLKLAIVRQRGLGQVWPDPANDGDMATWHATRADDPRGTVYSASYSMEDAANAKLTNKDNWQKYPRQMLQWRALGYLLDVAFGEVGTGLYCLPTRAEALTRSGWVTHEKLTVGDEVLAFDNTTGVCRWTPAQAINAYEAGQTYRIEHSRWASIATADHRWVVQRKPQAGRDVGRSVRTTAGLRQGEGSLLIAAPADDEPSTLTDREAAIVGWLLTDGYFQWDEDKGRGGRMAASIQQSKHVEAVRSLFRPGEAHESLRTAAGVQTIRGREYECRDAYTFKLSSAFAKTLLGKVGLRTKADAVLAVTRLSISARRAMFDAMVLANGSDASQGSSGQKHVSFFSGHRSVMDAFVALCALMGIGTGRISHTKGCWKVNLRRSRGVHVAKLSITEHVIEPVWCPTTSYGTWVTRLDGYVYVTGNSADELGAVTDDEGHVVIDVTEVTPLAGIEPKPPAPPSTANEVAPQDERDGIQARIDRLPPPAVPVLKEMWQKEGPDGTPTLWPLTVLPNRQVKPAHALIDAVEKRAKAGEWGEWAGAQEAATDATATQEPPDDTEGPAGAAEAPEGTEDDSDPECLSDGCDEPVTLFDEDGAPWCDQHKPL